METFFKHFADFIVGLFKHSAPVVVQAAEGAAVASAETDPKTAAMITSGVAIYNAAKQIQDTLKTPDSTTNG